MGEAGFRSHDLRTSITINIVISKVVSELRLKTEGKRPNLPFMGETAWRGHVNGEKSSFSTKNILPCAL